MIDIAVIGWQNQRKFLLREIRNEVQGIHKKWFRNIQFEQMIPCICNYCSVANGSDVKFFEASVLHRAQERGKTTVECDKEFIDVPVLGLLEGVFDEKELQQQEGVREHDYQTAPALHIHNYLPETPVPQDQDETTQQETKNHWRWQMVVSLVSAFICTVWAVTEWLADSETIPFEPVLGLVISLLAIAGMLIWGDKRAA